MKRSLKYWSLKKYNTNVINYKTMHKIDLGTLIKILQSNKEYLLFNVYICNNKERLELIFTDDYQRYYNKKFYNIRFIKQLKKDLKQQSKFYI